MTAPASNIPVSGGAGHIGAHLRYFNAVSTDPETHLAPEIIKAALEPDAGPVKIFGYDYNTLDGTCERD